MTKRDHKSNGHQGVSGENGGRNTDNVGGNKNNKRRGEKGKGQSKDGSKQIRAGCYFCEGAQKPEDYPHRLESAATPAES